MLYPLALAKTDDRQLLIRWSDGVEQRIPFRVLREACPCATCREKAEGKSRTVQTDERRGNLPILSPAEARPLDVLSMRPVGNYGYHVDYSDGHSTGIYTFEYLRSLADPQEA